MMYPMCFQLAAIKAAHRLMFGFPNQSTWVPKIPLIRP